MKRLLTVALAGFLLAACSSLPMPILNGQDDGPPKSPQSDVAWLFNDLNRLGPQILHEIYDQTLGVVQNYVEIASGHRADLQDARYLVLRFYPQGKSKSEEHYTAEAWFRFSGPGDKGLSLDFQHSPSPNKAIQSDDYL